LAEEPGVEKNNSVLLDNLHEVRYKKAAIEGSDVTELDTSGPAGGSYKVDLDYGLRQPALGCGNTLLDPAQLRPALHAARKDLHTGTTMDQRCTSYHTLAIADMVNTVVGRPLVRSVWDFLFEVVVVVVVVR
jgi:hypothetical protein